MNLPRVFSGLKPVPFFPWRQRITSSLLSALTLGLAAHTYAATSSIRYRKRWRGRLYLEAGHYSRSWISKDGHLDLAVSNRTDATLSILFGDGKGNFASHAVVPTAVVPGN
ncbi:MAG: hypothetical protein H0X40_01855 [Chthoniobacterales bacterium]|nr:hypothetical protein [Chthoniobacterales bacterium]